jgi:hypothetical protein
MLFVNFFGVGFALFVPIVSNIGSLISCDCNVGSILKYFYVYNVFNFNYFAVFDDKNIAALVIINILAII